MSIVTLLTDFGLGDGYVGQVKGAVLSVCADAHLVDLTHAVPPQDVRAGAFLLWTSVEVFPKDAVHLAVVDPGVGSSRRAIALRCARGDVLVGPDNGLLLPAAERLGGVAQAIELTERRFWRADPSSTFHGRDLFGPVAGHLARGVALEALGVPARDLEPLRLPMPVREGTAISGEVLHVDAFGNVVTNVPGAQLFGAYRVHIAGVSMRGQSHYQAVPAGELVALVGSSGLVEVSVRDGSAATKLGVRRGERVVVELLGA